MSKFGFRSNIIIKILSSRIDIFQNIVNFYLNATNSQMVNKGFMIV